MAQIKIYGLREHLDRNKRALSDTIHSCAVEVLKLPVEKRFHRFFAMDPADFYYPADRSEKYTIVEISMFEGRSVETKKQLIGRLFERISAELDISPQDIEIAIFEAPRHNWGIRGLPGDEIGLNYKVDV